MLGAYLEALVRWRHAQGLGAGSRCVAWGPVSAAASSAALGSRLEATRPPGEPPAERMLAQVLRAVLLSPYPEASGVPSTRSWSMALLASADQMIRFKPFGNCPSSAGCSISGGEE